MSVAVDEVKVWALSHNKVFGRRIGHVAASRNGCWVATACGSFGNFPLTEDRPDLVCRTCRDRLRHAEAPATEDVASDV